MLVKFISLVFVWILSVPAWIIISAFIHELAHLSSSLACGFRVREYRLLTLPWGVRGYVDVAIPRGINNYYLKKGIMHLSGVVAHLLLIIVSMLFFILLNDWTAKGVFLLGAVINLYLLLTNLFSRDSDGHKFWVNVVKKTH